MTVGELPTGPRASVNPQIGDVIQERRRQTEASVGVIVAVELTQVMVKSDKDQRIRPLRRDQLQRYIKVGRRKVEPYGDQ